MKKILNVVIRALITACAFWWISRSVDMASIRKIFASADRKWFYVGIFFFSMAQAGCIARWSLFAPKHPSVNWKFLINSFFVASFFNLLLPTTIGGDVMRGYDLIKATGQWREPLASVLLDRLTGLAGLLLLCLGVWFLCPIITQDPVLRVSFFGFCLLILGTFAVLGSRRILHTMLRPFSKIGLGQLGSHAKQFQETLLSYIRQPKIIWSALLISFGIQLSSVLMYSSVATALHLMIPFDFLLLIVPIVFAVSQLPISLNGWGIREGAVILFLNRVDIKAPQALSLSLACAVIPFLSAAIGGVLFILRRRKKH